MVDSYQYTYDVEVWTLPFVMFLLIYPILLFLLARMLFPTGVRGHDTDLDEYFYDQWKWFYFLILGIIVVSFLQNIIVSGGGYI
jgi:choline-glycine betaine transporter